MNFASTNKLCSLQHPAQHRPPCFIARVLLLERGDFGVDLSRLELPRFCARSTFIGTGLASFSACGARCALLALPLIKRLISAVGIPALDQSIAHVVSFESSFVVV